MSLERDQSVDAAAARAVRLAGVEFSVLPLSLRAILQTAALIGPLNAAAARLGTNEFFDETALRPVVEIVCAGLRRTYPKITADDIFEMPIKVPELFEAAFVVIEQGGGKKVPAGESQATSDGTQPTGASSSPSS